MRRVVPISLLVTAGVAVAQTPEPPRPLPAGLVGKPPATTPITPAAGVATPAPPARAPIARFEPLHAFPPETVQAVYGMRTGAEWLAKRQQPHGRFLFGVNPALRAPLDGDSEYRQAVAAWGVCAAARFTGDDKLAAAGGQAILALMTLTANDPADPACKVPTVAAPGDAIGFAAAVVLAVCELPSADAKLHADAEKLCAFLRKKQQADGSIGPADADPAVAGLALQAIAASMRAKLDAGKQESLAKGLAFYRAQFRAKPMAVRAGVLIPAAVECFTQTKNTDAAGTAIEMADWLLASQFAKGDARQMLWAGGFRTADGVEPGFESAHPARGLAAATHLTRLLPDAVRYAKYRPAAVDALGFVRGLQYTADTTGHFEGSFRAQYVLGGVRVGTTDGNIRADATALGVTAFVRFLESGAEGRD